MQPDHCPQGRAGDDLATQVTQMVLRIEQLVPGAALAAGPPCMVHRQFWVAGPGLGRTALEAFLAGSAAPSKEHSRLALSAGRDLTATAAIFDARNSPATRSFSLAWSPPLLSPHNL